jgi:hypothetical protein
MRCVFQVLLGNTPQTLSKYRVTGFPSRGLGGRIFLLRSALGSD